MSRAPHRSWIVVSRSQIARNYQAVTRLVGPEVEVAPVVKADAYRHGAAEISRVLQDEGARWFAVSNVDEGIALRQAGIQGRILVMADFLPFELDALRIYNLTPVIHTLDHIAELDRIGSSLAYHLKIDTGMGRLGTRAGAEDIARAAGAARWARLEGILTHFASAGDYTKEQTAEQIAYFDAVCAELLGRGVQPDYLHMGSTIAVAYGRRESWRNLVRPGHAIYGYVSPAKGEPPPERLLDVRPALSWHAAILGVKDVPRGARIGYGAMFVAPEAMRIGVVSAGYADGIPHRLSNRGHVIAGGKFAKILGAVSMDLTTVDLSEAPHLKPGDAVTLLGSEGDASQDAQQMARIAGTISYSVLCGISARVQRVYVD
jgi:alanine racemase